MGLQLNNANGIIISVELRKNIKLIKGQWKSSWNQKCPFFLLQYPNHIHSRIVHLLYDRKCDFFVVSNQNPVTSFILLNKISPVSSNSKKHPSINQSYPFSAVSERHSANISRPSQVLCKKHKCIHSFERNWIWFSLMSSGCSAWTLSDLQSFLKNRWLDLLLKSVLIAYHVTVSGSDWTLPV